MALWRLQEALRELALAAPPPLASHNGQRRALFAPFPGDQHAFGAIMVADCFERAGWSVDLLQQPTAAELTGAAAQNAYDLVALTISCDVPNERISNQIAAIRAVSGNNQLRIMLGGRAVNEQPELVQICKADAMAYDALSAVTLADQLVPKSSKSALPQS
jgi:MerR family transcriptional regulator, light-induced transcriptional regulator